MWMIANNILTVNSFLSYQIFKVLKHDARLEGLEPSTLGFGDLRSTN